MIMNIAQKRKEVEGKSLYIRAAEKFDTNYHYVAMIATGKRNPVRGKGLKIKEFMLSELNKEN